MNKQNDTCNKRAPFKKDGISKSSGTSQGFRNAINTNIFAKNRVILFYIGLHR